MKATSIAACKTKELFAGTHRQRIVKALTEPLTGSEIGLKIGLTTHQVMKRMSELERSLEVFVAGELNGEGIYYKADPQTTLTHQISQEEKHKAKYIKRLKGIKKEFGETIMSEEVGNAIWYELNRI